MKRLFLLLLTSGIFTIGFTQNNVLRGLVKLQSSGSQPLAGVKVSAFGAGPVYSNSSGMFELTFNSKKPGSSISLIIEKDGYELINDKELESCVLRAQADDLEIVVMAKRGERNKQALVYYNIIIQNASNSYDKEFKSINTRLNKLEKDDEERGVLLQQIETLQQEKEKLLNRAEELAKQLAIVDLDQASGLAQEAFEKFESGDVKAALAVLDDEALDESLKQAKQERAKLEQQLLQADSAFQQSVENYMIKARFCISDRQYTAAYKNYLKAVEADSSNLDHLLELANYCSRLNQQERSIRFYQQALPLAKSEAIKTTLLTSLGRQYIHNNEFDKAEETLLAALEIAEALVETYPDYYAHKLGYIKLNLADYYAMVNNFYEAGLAYEYAFDIYEWLAEGNPEYYEPYVLTTLTNWGNMQKLHNEIEEAEATYLRALEIATRLAQTDPSEYEPDIAIIHLNLANLYSSIEEFEKSRTSAERALKMYQRLAEKNPERYEHRLAHAQLTLGMAHSDLREFAQAVHHVEVALDIYQRLTDKNPQRFKTYLASSKENLGIIFFTIREVEKAEKLYLEALNLIQEIMSVTSAPYRPTIATLSVNLGHLYINTKDFEKADSFYSAALKYYQELVDENPQRFYPHLCNINIRIGYLKKALLEETIDFRYRKEGLAYLESAQRILSFYQQDNTLPAIASAREDYKYLTAYFETVTEEDLLVQKAMIEAAPLENQSIDEADPKKALELQKEAVDQLDNALEEYPENQDLRTYMAGSYGNLAWCYLFTRQFPEAEHAARRGLELDESQRWINTNLASALLYQGQMEEAKALYLKLKDETDGDSTFREIFLQDLDALEEKGITCEGVKEIRELLK